MLVYRRVPPTSWEMPLHSLWIADLPLPRVHSSTISISLGRNWRWWRGELAAANFWFIPTACGGYGWIGLVGWLLSFFPLMPQPSLVETGKLPLDRLFSSVFQLKKSLPALFAAGCDHSWSLDSLVALLLCGRPDNFPAFWIFSMSVLGQASCPEFSQGVSWTKK